MRFLSAALVSAASFIGGASLSAAHSKTTAMAAAAPSKPAAAAAEAPKKPQAPTADSLPELDWMATSSGYELPPVSDELVDSHHPGTPLFGYQFRPFVLGEVINLSHDAAIFRFLTPAETDVFDLPACSTLQCLVKNGGNRVEQIQRFYTPITPNGTKGYFDIIVRKYPHGRMTEHLFSMHPGEKMHMRCITTKLKYQANKWKEIGMLGGGTGITSLLQVIRAAVNNPQDHTKLSLLFANRSEEQTLLKGVLDEIADKSLGQLKVHYTIDKATTKEWKGFEGYINEAMIKATMPSPTDEDSLVLVCGPDPFMISLCGTARAVLKTMSGGLAYQPMHTSFANIGDLGGLLRRMGYHTERVYRF